MDYFKIAVLNNSGNVGKSTLCQTLLLPRINDAELIRIETINHDDSNEIGLSAQDMSEVLDKINISDKAVIDIGSSNIENFMSGLLLNTGSQDDIDCYLVPTTPQVKQQKDTIETIRNLLDLGVEAENIFILLNKVDDRLNLERQFETLVASQILSKLNRKSLTDFPVILDSEIFSLLEKIQKSFSQAISDDTDYKTAIRATQDKKERSILSIKQTAMRLAKGHNLKLDIEFQKLPFNQ